MGTPSGKRQLTLNLTKSRSNKSSRIWDLYHGVTPNSKCTQGSSKIKVHFVLAVKHNGCHKARLVTDGNLTRQQVEMVYSGVVSLRNLRIVMLLVEVNQLELWGADIGNAYLKTHTNQKLFIVGGPKFDYLEGHILVMGKALYGTRTAGGCWHDHLFDVLNKMGFIPCKAVPDVWMRPPEDNSCYLYIAVYVDDLVMPAKNPKKITDDLQFKHQIKIKGTGLLTHHLGCTYTRDPDGTLVADPTKYIKKVLESYEHTFGSKPRKARPPLEESDYPELDTSELCNDVQIM